MKATITNKMILLEKPSEDACAYIQKILSYKDKSKQYLLNRMKRNKFLCKSQQFLDLKRQVDCTAYHVLPNGALVFSSGHAHHLKEINVTDIEDKRSDTGASIPIPWKNKQFELREYQEDALNAMIKSWRGTVNLATGLGKTLLATYAIKTFRKKSLIIVPSESIAKQFLYALQDAFGESTVALYGAGKKKTSSITVAIAASVINNISLFASLDLGLILIDEGHHTPADTFSYISKSLGGVGRIYGLTATDYRNDGKDILIEAACGPTIIKRDLKWGILNGWLAKPKFIIKKINTIGNDYNDKLKSYREHVSKNQRMSSVISDDLQSLMVDNYVMCLVADIEFGNSLSKISNIPFAKGSDKQSQEYVELLNRKKIRGIVGTTGKVGEGTDTKSITSLILANFVASKGLVVQCIGRGLRKIQGKEECIIYDYIPLGSSMLTRHAWDRISFYREITDNIEIVEDTNPKY